MAIADGSTALTTSGVLIGSPAYMSPERARGEPATRAADMWSLGATLYAAVEGRPPFDREGALAILTAVVGGVPDPPVRAGPLWLVISGLLRTDPAKRQGAAEAGRRLRQVVGDSGAATGARLAETTVPLAAADRPAARTVVIDQTTHPKPDPLADWQQQQASRLATYPGYHLIRLQAVRYAQADRAADWEFTCNNGNQRVHVLNRNILAGAHHAYALYWSTPASQWHISFHYFRAFAATFRPAGTAQGS
jgi:serine/threonine protein kinase